MQYSVAYPITSSFWLSFFDDVFQRQGKLVCLLCCLPFTLSWVFTLSHACLLFCALLNRWIRLWILSIYPLFAVLSSVNQLMLNLVTAQAVLFIVYIYMYVNFWLYAERRSCQKYLLFEIFISAGSVVKKFPERSITLTEGEQLELKCAAWGHPAPTIRWRRTDLNNVEIELTSSGRVSLADSDGLRNASLTVAEVTLKDYGSYTCIADNGLSYSNSTFNTITILVRVKGTNYSALWNALEFILLEHNILSNLSRL